MDTGVEFIADLAVVLLTAAAGVWLARALKMTTVVGYLFAGLVVGAPEITVVQVADADRVHVIAQVGLVFLMFSIGARIRLREVKGLGWRPLVATTSTALLMLLFGRFAGMAMGLNPVQGLFFAAMLMVSSSAIIVKVLTETGVIHRRPGQLALGQTLLEDFVAVIMLTILGSLAAYEQADAGGWGAVAQSLGQLGTFVVLFVVTGLLLLPRILRRMVGNHGQEQLVILLTGLVFGLALLTVQAGYSLALGAFLSGLLVAEIPHSRTIERSFTGMRDVFTAVFFVAVGMSIELSRVGDAVGLIVVGTLLALVGRFLCAVFSWLLVGENERSAMQTAIFVMPIGEFSFIIAGLGVTAGLLPERFQAAAVGIALLTSLLAPLCMQHSEKVAVALSPERFQTWRDGFGAYRSVWAAIGRRGGSSLLWRLLRPRLGQVAREIFWISAVLLFSRPLYEWADARAIEADGASAVWRAWLPWGWLLVILVVLPAFVALIRNLDALTLLVADSLTPMSSRRRPKTGGVLLVLRVAVVAAMAVWIFNLLPWSLLAWPVLAGIALVVVVGLVAGWRLFIRWHARAEVELRELIAGEAREGGSSLSSPQWEAARRGWGLGLQEVELPEGFKFAGMSIGELRLRERTGVTVVGVERQGWNLSQPGPQTHLFPEDTLLLAGSKEEIEAARGLLKEEREASGTQPRLYQAILESTRVLAGSPLRGRSLAELNWPRLEGVQIVAARREGRQFPNPGPQWRLAEGDELLLAGAEESLRRVFRLLEPRGEPGDGGAVS